jgi:hypothetical protein
MVGWGEVILLRDFGPGLVTPGPPRNCYRAGRWTQKILNTFYVGFPARLGLRCVRRTVGFQLIASGRAKARSGLRMMPTFPLPSLKFRTAGFPQYGFKAGRSDRAFPFFASSRQTVCHCPSCSPLPSSDPRSVPGDVARWSTSVRAAAAALPRGPSLRTGLFCPVPSTLAAPSAPLAGTSRFHRSAVYTKCLRCAHCA